MAGMFSGSADVLGNSSSGISVADQASLDALKTSPTALYEQYLQTTYFRESYAAGLVSSGVTTALLATGRPGLVPVPFLAGEIVAKLDFGSGNTALSVGTHQWAALCDSTRTVLAVTNDDTSNAWSSLTMKSFTLTSPYTITSSGLYYVAIMVAASVVPTLSVLSVQAVDTKMVLPSGLSSTTGQAGVPSLATQFGAPSTNAGVKVWVGVS